MSSQNSKDLNVKGPDVFQAKVGDFLAGVAQNPKPLFAFITGVLVLIAAGYGVKYFMAHKADGRRGEISKIDEVYEGELKTYAKAREGLEKQRDTLKAAQPKPATADAKPVEETPAIKDLNKQIEAMKPDHTASSDKYLGFFKANPKTPEGAVAGLKYAAFAAEQNKLEDAQKVLEDLTKDNADHPVLQTQALMLLISIQEDRNELDKALASAEALDKIAAEDLKPRVLLTKAQIYYLKKDFPKTKETAQQIVTAHESSPEADRARSLIALLPE